MAKPANSAGANDIANVLIERPKLIEEITPDINYDETNDFDLKPEKKPTLSTLKTQHRKLNKLCTPTKATSIVNEFDRVKFAVNLEKYGEQIGFSIINLEETTEPRKSPVSRHFERNEELRGKYVGVNATLSLIDNIASSLDDFSDVEKYKEEEEELNSTVLMNSNNETIRELAKELEEQIRQYNELIVTSVNEANARMTT